MNNNSTFLPAAIIGGALILLLTAVTVTAIIKYDTVDEALKVWSALGSIAGVVTGAVVTYFFKQGEVKAAENKAAEAKSKEEEAKKKAEDIAKHADDAIRKLSRELSSDAWSKIERDPLIKAFSDRASVFR